MAVRDKSSQTINATVLKNETADQGNTRDRVYNLFKDLIDSSLFYDQVKQVLGSSTTDVMSQKAVSDAINAIVITLNNVLTAGNDAGNQQIKNLADPTLPQDADTKAARDSADAVIQSALTNHVNDTANPHAVTKAQVGLPFADNTSDVNKPVSTAQAAADLAIATQLIDGATDNTLKKLQDKITAIQAIIGSGSPDVDSIVNTVSELLAVFSSFPEGADMVTLLSAKVNTSDVYNALDQIIAGKVLDARQGKVLNDLITAANTAISLRVLTSDVYNALDQLTAGKVLDARQGKALKDLIDANTTTIATKLTGTLASDAETQISAAVSEDNKFVSRLKLFNWFTWAKTQAQTFTNLNWLWNFATTVTGTTDTLDSARAGKKIRYNSAADVTVTLPLNATDAIAIGTRYVLRQSSTGKVIVFPAVGVTINTPDATLLSTQSQYSELCLVKSATDTWELTFEVSSHWTWIKTQAQTIAALWTIADVKISNQAATSTNQRPLFIDNTGKVQKSGFANFDETNKKVTWTGKDNLTSVLARFENSDLASLFEIFNDFSAQFYGTVSELSVPSGITAGNAYITFLDLIGEQYALKDASSNRYLSFEKLSSTDYTALGLGSLNNRIIRQRRVSLFDKAIGIVTVRDQASIITSTTAAAQNIITNIAIPTGYMLNFFANIGGAAATDGSVVGLGQISFTAKNIGGTVTLSTNDNVSQPLPNTLNGNFNTAINGTGIDIRFQNETGTGKTYTVWIDFEYTLTLIPS